VVFVLFKMFRQLFVETKALRQRCRKLATLHITQSQSAFCQLSSFFMSCHLGIFISYNESGRNLGPTENFSNYNFSNNNGQYGLRFNEILLIYSLSRSQLKSPNHVPSPSAPPATLIKICYPNTYTICCVMEINLLVLLLLLLTDRDCVQICNWLVNPIMLLSFSNLNGTKFCLLFLFSSYI
jgi:hypothetical protein